MNRHQRREQQKLLQQSVTSATPEILDALRLAHSYQLAGSLAPAEEIYQKILKQQPRHADALFLMGMVKEGLGDFQAALFYLNKALAVDGNNHLYHYHKGVALQNSSEFAQAKISFKRTIELAPDFTEAYLGLGVVTDHLKLYEEAIPAYEHVLKLSPQHSAAANNLATLYRDQGRIEEAITLYRQAISNVKDPVIHSNLLLCLNYELEQTPKTILEEHQEWDRLYAVEISPPCPISTEGTRKIRIGYISSDFREHPVASFFLPYLKFHNKMKFKIYCYYSDKNEDNSTKEIKKYTDHWRPIARLNHDVVAEQIRADQLDILVDLGGHTAGNRLQVLALKPAPVQISWIGYFNTTGLRAMDYFISDPVHMHPDATQGFTEKIIYLPDGYAPYEPPHDAPECAAILPAKRNGFITFGSFNHMAKINKEVIDVWAKILHEVPRSRLILKAATLGAPSLRNRILEAFIQRGIEASRLDLQGWSPPKELYALYNQIDIALDPFPFSGGLTTCNSLWMGVPVITLAGIFPVGRQSATYLSQIGLKELISNTKEDYISITKTLCNDVEKLSALHASLRQRMKDSPLCDGERFARNLEDAYQKILA